MNARSYSARRAHMTRRILRVWNVCTEDEKWTGRAWYARAESGARNMLPYDVVRAAGVIAALSPRCAWSTNLNWARQILTAAAEGHPVPAVHTTAMRQQAWRIANGAHPLSVLNGPKVRAFFSNITGDHDVVTVDVWAARVAQGWKQPQPDNPSRVARGRRPTGTGSIALTGVFKNEGKLSKSQYLMIADAYREAARAAGVSPRTMQATCWTHIRGAHA